MEVSVLTPKCTLVPSSFFEPDSAGTYLAQVCVLNESDSVKWCDVPEFDAVLVYADSDDYDKRISENGQWEGSFPEMRLILRDLSKCDDYNRILCTWADGYLYLAIAQGNTLLLSNTFKAADFVTAEYFIFLSMNSLQLNPEISTVCWRHPIGADEEMSLYRYFKAVETI